MPIDLEDMLRRNSGDQASGYDDTQVLLYNLGIGMGRDPTDGCELPFVFERPALRVVPTFASTLGGGSASLLAGAGLDWSRVLHGEQRLTFHPSMPPAARLVGATRVAGVIDKGASKGAMSPSSAMSGWPAANRSTRANR